MRDRPDRKGLAWHPSWSPDAPVYGRLVEKSSHHATDIGRIYLRRVLTPKAQLWEFDNAQFPDSDDRWLPESANLQS